MTHLLQRHALEKMSSDSQSHLNISPTLNNNITIFASLSTLEQAINNHKSMIVVLHKKERHVCIATTRMDDMFVCHELKFNDHCGYHVSNLWFAPVSIGPPISKPFTSKDDVLNNSADIALLMPLTNYKYNEDPRCNSHYVVLTKNWYTRTQHGTYCLPSLSRELFQFIIN